MCIEGCFVWKVSKVCFWWPLVFLKLVALSLVRIVAFIIFEAVFAWLSHPALSLNQSLTRHLHLSTYTYTYTHVHEHAHTRTHAGRV